MNWKFVAFCIVLWFAYLNIASTAPCSGCTGSGCSNDTSNCTDDCDDSVCSNGGQCFVEEDGSTGCICSSGYTGDTCDDEIATTLVCHSCNSITVEGTGNLTGDGVNKTIPGNIPECTSMGTETCTGSPPSCYASTMTYDVSDSVDTAKVIFVVHGCQPEVVASSDMNSCVTSPTTELPQSEKGEFTSMMATQGLKGIKDVNTTVVSCMCDSESCNILGYSGASTAEPETNSTNGTDSSAPTSHRGDISVFVYGLAIWLTIFCLPNIKN